MICLVLIFLILFCIIFIILIIESLKCDSFCLLGFMISCVLFVICLRVIFFVLLIFFIVVLIFCFLVVKMFNLGLNNFIVNWVFMLDSNLLIWVVIGWEKFSSKLGNFFKDFFIFFWSLYWLDVLVYLEIGFNFM